MGKKYTIKVFKDGMEIATIKRVLYAEMIGNFNPFFCRYNNERRLVRSTYGDLSDPWRRSDEYAKGLFIEV